MTYTLGNVNVTDRVHEQLRQLKIEYDKRVDVLDEIVNDETKSDAVRSNASVYSALASASFSAICAADNMLRGDNAKAKAINALKIALNELGIPYERMNF